MGARAPTAARRYYASQFRHVFGRSLDERVAATGWPGSTASSRRTSRRSASTRPRPTPDLSRAGPRLGLAGLLRPGGAGALRRVQLPRRRLPRRRHLARDGCVAEDRGHQGTAHLHGDLARLGPGSRTLFYTTDNNAFRDLRRVDPATGKSRMLLKDARIGELVFDRTDRSLWGVRALNGIATLVRIPPPLRRLDLALLLALRRGRLRHRRLPGRRAPLRLGRRGERAPEPARDETGGAAQGRPDAGRELRLRQRHPLELRVLPGRKVPLRQLVLHRGVERLPLRPRDREARGGEQHRDRLLPPDPDRRRRARGLPLHRPGLRARPDPGEAARGRQRDHASWASRSPRSTRSSRSGSSARRPRCRSTRWSPAGVRTARSVASGSSRSTPWSRATRTSRRWACGRTSPTR